MARVSDTIYKYSVLVDTGPLYALADSADGRHLDARECLRKISTYRLPLYVTTLTIAECHRLILYQLGIQRGLNFLNNVYDGSINIIRLDTDDEDEARGMLQKYQDQSISFTDAGSLAAMKRLGIIKAFSFDWHFDILGFYRIPPAENLLA